MATVCASSIVIIISARKTALRSLTHASRLKAGLELTPDQAKNWPAFEQTLRDMAQLRAQRRAAREANEQNPSQTPIAPFDRLSQRRQHGQGQRRAQADRRDGPAAVHEPQRSAEGALQEARADALSEAAVLEPQ
jgi:hypothetical protein